MCFIWKFLAVAKDRTTYTQGSSWQQPLAYTALSLHSLAANLPARRTPQPR